MFVSTAHRRIILPSTTNVQEAKKILPEARDFVFEGQHFVTFPHDISETRVLRNIGIPVPAPIEHYYGWPGQFKPMAHQIATAAFLTLHQRAFVLNDIGTGKTMASLWAADFLMECDLIYKALIVAPLSTLVSVHGSSVFQNLTHRRHAILHGPTLEMKRRILKSDVDFLIINKEGATGMAKYLAGCDDIHLIMLDELADYRNGTTQRWKRAREFIREDQWVWGLTGRPTPNEPTDAYAQAKLVNPMGRVLRYRSFTEFKTRTMFKESMFRWLPREDANDQVFDIMQPAIRFSREECLDLPPCTTQTLEVDLTPEQKKAYKDLANQFATEINGEIANAANEAIKIMRLVQVVSGTLYDTAGNRHVIPAGPRLSLVREIIANASRKVIVFCPFTGNLQPLVDSLKDIASAVMVYGDTKVKERETIFNNFQHADEPRVLIAHPQCMAHGLTLTSAATIIWWAPINSHDIYEQANGRINRKGQDHPSTIIHISGTAVEKRMYKRLEERGKLQGILLEMVEEAKRM